MDRIHSSEIKSILREALAVQHTLRELGYRQEDLSFGITEGKVFVYLETEEKDLIVTLGRVEKWEEAKLLNTWKKLADAWNNQLIMDMPFIISMSKVHNNREQFIETIKDAGVPYPGPELLN